MLTAQEIYTAARTLSLPERLRLAALLLDELDQSPMPQIDPAHLAGYSDAWTDEDIHDLRQFSARHLSSVETSPETEQDSALPPLKDLLKMKMEQSREPEHV
jgi:hypothetical protein